MDGGFDDLLSGPTRNFEDNPFEDPFSKRSNSPDPWSNTYSQAQEDAALLDPYHNAFENSEPIRSTTPIESTATESHDEPVLKTPTEPSTPASVSAPAVPVPTMTDPLDSAAANAEDSEEEEEAFKGSRSPGFLESIPAGFSEIATIRPTQPEEEEPSIPAPDYIESEHTISPPHRSPVVSITSSATHSKQVSIAESSTRTPMVSPTSSTFADNDVLSPFQKGYTSNGGGDGLSGTGVGFGGDMGGGWGTTTGAHSTWGGSDPPPPPADPSTDSDDDKPIGQVVNRRSKDSEGNLYDSRRKNDEPPVFVITVDDPQKVGDPIRSFTMYTVHTRTTSPLFQKSAFSVLRRYSDFLWLYETLSVNCPGVVVPPVPEKNPFGRFDDNFVRRRRQELEKCITKIANHPVLGKDPDLKMFLESDSFALDIKHRKAELAHEQGGLLGSLSKSFSGPKFYETDEWFDRQRGYLDSLETQLKGLVKAIDTAAKHRQELSIVTSEFAQTVEDLSASDVGKQLSQTLAGLATVQRKAQDLQTVQSQQDMSTVMSTVDEYSRLINSVRLAMASRIRIYGIWQNADDLVRRVKSNHERSRAQGQRMQHSLTQVAEAERKAIEAKHEFERVSKLIKDEVARFERERVEDLKDSLQRFLEGMITRQKEHIADWEAYQQLLLNRVGGGGRPPIVSGAFVSPVA